ncbi:hypothetical protein ALP05_200120 [Pseudomonas caricapapayae]|uniref:HPr kinase n=1 Tax=Pseudomonas caricapapayae TaxID=46678 RepID=A0A3M6ERV1_9PSED|nr:hypothetical protein [Pseudomonas caricapapayae]RMV71068.1 hypothetical protein ALP05_200120 [Pseudomonas caricapapayae]
MGYLMSNGVFRISLQVEDDPAGLAKRLIAFFTPYLLVENNDATPDLTVCLHAPQAFKDSWKARCQTPHLIRKSYAEGFTLKVWQGDLPNGDSVAWDPESKVGYRCSISTRKVDFYGAEDAFIHLIELVRYYGLLVESAKGSAVLHSSAVVSLSRESVTAFAGVKGAGKTTTMLEYLLAGKHSYYSGDKLLLDVQDGRVRARGWPDYPHIGLGSLRQHPRLIEEFPELTGMINDPACADRHKVLIAPERFAEVFGRAPTGSSWLDEVVLPQVTQSAEVPPQPLSTAEILALIDGDSVFEWPAHFTISTWHGIPPSGTDIPCALSDGLRQALSRLRWTYRPGHRSAPASDSLVTPA